MRSIPKNISICSIFGLDYAPTCAYGLGFLAFEGERMVLFNDEEAQTTPNDIRSRVFPIELAAITLTCETLTFLVVCKCATSASTNFLETP